MKRIKYSKAYLVYRKGNIPMEGNSMIIEIPGKDGRIQAKLKYLSILSGEKPKYFDLRAKWQREFDKYEYQGEYKTLLEIQQLEINNQTK